MSSNSNLHSYEKYDSRYGQNHGYPHGSQQAMIQGHSIGGYSQGVSKSTQGKLVKQNSSKENFAYQEMIARERNAAMMKNATY